MNYSDEIGGFLGLELPEGRGLYHDRAIPLNSARNGLRYLIRSLSINTIYVPYYTCPVVWETILDEDCRMEFYSIDKNLKSMKKIPREAFVLYTNYYGICAKNIREMARQYPRLIVDNAQGFYMPPTGFASFYSPRKFFGVSDGGFLYSPQKLPTSFPRGESYQRCSHLLKRLDLSASDAYEDFQKNDAMLGNEDIRYMSKLTERILQSIDYGIAKERRMSNFNWLHSRLGDYNALRLNLDKDDVPMVYPFFCGDKTLRQRLIAAKIHVARYWPGIENYCPSDAFELTLRDNVIPLPCDQRYSVAEMKKICRMIVA